MKIRHLCCFHPILVTWFLVVFGDEVTKYYVIICLFFILYTHLALLSKKVNKLLRNNLVTSSQKQPKTKLPKWDENLKNKDFTKI